MEVQYSILFLKKLICGKMSQSLFIFMTGKKNMLNHFSKSVSLSTF